MTRVRSLILAILCVGIAAWFVPLAVRAQSGSTAMLTAYWLGIYSNIDLAEVLDQAPESADFEPIATARPDQCHYGVDASGEDTLYQMNISSFMSRYPGDLTKTDAKSCSKAAGSLKTNQAYVWGLAEHNGVLWFGTIANTLCLVMDGFGLSIPPHETTAWACEMAGGRDARPPRIFTYNLATSTLTDKTASVLGAGSVDSNRLQYTIGLRSAGSHEGVVFLGGIGPSGVNLFAFNADTGQYIGSHSPVDSSGSPYTNIRQFIVANGELYVGVGVGTSPLGGGGAFGSASGAILRWTGNVSDPFQFEVVTQLLADPAYLVQYQDRIAVSTWGEPYRLGGQLIYLSPVFGDDGMLTPADGAWSIVWRLSEYEVEPSALQFGGAIGVLNGYLVWGTMFIPGTGAMLFEEIYPDAPDEQTAAFLGTYRPIMIFRGANVETATPTIDLLYGNEQLPKYNATANEWTLVPNGLGQTPLMGAAGFGSFFNNYTWWMTTHSGKLFVGTMDYLYVAARLAELTGGFDALPKQLVKQARGLEGADLWALVDGDQPAYPLSLTGAGNIANYGIRTMIGVDSDLYLGSANPMNLLMDSPKGGWEMIKVVPNN